MDSAPLPLAGPPPAPLPHAEAPGSSRRRASPIRILARASVVVAVLALGWFTWVLSREAEAATYAEVDLARVKMHTGATWSDPRWEQEIALVLSAQGRAGVEDPAAVERIASELARLSFVAEVGEVEVLWPDGLKIPLRLRMPVACVALGAQFQPVDASGVLLSGRWPAPPERDGGCLPVITCEKAELERAHAGMVLWSESARDGLAVAESLWAHLDRASVARLGRCVIDARSARRASVDVVGVVLMLPNGRRVNFGRAPNTGEPGELPVATKWESLVRALALLEPADADGAGAPATDWELVDVRWDRPELLSRGATPETGAVALPDARGE